MGRVFKVTLTREQTAVVFVQVPKDAKRFTAFNPPYTTEELAKLADRQIEWEDVGGLYMDWDGPFEQEELDKDEDYLHEHTDLPAKN